MKKVYICECCKTTYDSELAATGCETKHLKATDGVIVGATYNEPRREPFDDSKYPKTLKVQFGDWIAHYSCTGGRSANFGKSA